LKIHFLKHDNSYSLEADTFVEEIFRYLSPIMYIKWNIQKLYKFLKYFLIEKSLSILTDDYITYNIDN
jgi:hypothetical protein